MKIVFYNSILFCFLFASCGNDMLLFDELFPDNAAYMNMQRPRGSYNYPVYPGTKKWTSFTTGQEMVDACQIPVKTLHKMSTQAVIQAIWEYPLLGDFFVFHGGTYQSTFENMFSSNNAYMEFCKRADAGVNLLERYVLVDPLTPMPRLASQILEILISQPVFLAQLSKTERKTLVETAFIKDDLRQKNLEHNSSARFNKHTTFLLISRVMVASNYIPYFNAVTSSEDLKAYNDGWDLYGFGFSYMGDYLDNHIALIINFANNFLNE